MNWFEWVARKLRLHMKKIEAVRKWDFELARGIFAGRWR